MNLTTMMMETKQEGITEEKNSNNNEKDKFTLKGGASSSTSTRQWSAFRNPRIVRVSRSFGGKDRHSKVCTIRGLRDRRIRLSVPTAIQLYDLQDKLGLSQPSKVIDWLLEATKLDIDKLPPLHFPLHPQFQTLFPHHLLHDPSISPFAAAAAAAAVDSPASSRFLKGKDLVISSNSDNNKGKWMFKSSNNNNQFGIGNGYGYGYGYNGLSSGTTTQRLFPMGNATTNNNPLQSLLNYNNSSSFSDGSSSLSTSASYYHGGDYYGGGGCYPMINNNNSGGLMQFNHLSSLQVGPSGSSSQLLFGPLSSAGAATQQIFTPYAPPFVTTPASVVESNNNNGGGGDQIRHQFNSQIHQFLNSSSSSSSSSLFYHHHHSLFNSSPVRPFPTLPFSSKLLDSSSDRNGGHQPDHSNNKGTTTTSARS